MLFHLFCMFHDYWRIEHRSQDSAGKSTVRMQYFGRSKVEGNYTKNPIFPDDEGSQKGEPGAARVGPHPRENTREKRALRRAGIRRGNSLREGEIDAIVTVIELDIIAITIIIISTIITAVITAGHRHRRSNLGLILIV